MMAKKKSSANPKAKKLSDEKNYHPITCSKISNKLLTELVGKCMKDQGNDNDICD